MMNTLDFWTTGNFHTTSGCCANCQITCTVSCASDGHYTIGNIALGNSSNEADNARIWKCKQIKIRIKQSALRDWTNGFNI